MSLFHKMTLENWKKVIDVNLNSIFNITSQIVNKMRENNFGRIVHISSVNGQKVSLVRQYMQLQNQH